MTTRFLTFSLGDGPAYNARAHLAMLAVMAHAPAGSEFLIISDRGTSAGSRGMPG